MSATKRLSEHQKRAVAVKAEVDPRTVQRFMAGQPIRPGGRERIERALVDLGLGDFVRRSESTEGGQQG